MRSMRNKRIRKSYSVREKVERAFYRIPAWQRKYLADTKEGVDRIISQMTRQVELAKERKQRINIQKAFSSTAQTLSRHSGEGTRRFLFKILKSEWTSVYNHYNTYVYGLGYSSADYFYNPNNSNLTQQGSNITMTLNLPNKSRGISYDTLSIEYDFSQEYSYAEMN